MLEWIVNYITLIAFAAFTIDNLIQIRHIWKRKSSKDISIKGSSIRLSAGLIILIKFLTLKDIYLVVGQGIFIVTLATYFVLLLKFRK